MEKCILCGSEIGSYHSNWRGTKGDFAYFERGLSASKYLCRDCFKHKQTLLNLDAEEKEILNSEKYMQSMMEGKVSEIKDVIQKWIDGESENYFPNMSELEYYVEGPYAYLFVFRDRAVILSSILDGMKDKTRINFDAAMLFPTGVNESGFLIFDDEKNCMEDKKKLHYRPDAKNKYGNAHANDFIMAFTSLGGLNYKSNEELTYTYGMSDKGNYVQLEKSLGDYGTLNFLYMTYEEKTFSFEFFYYQNQLMEEIYNYIQHRIAVNGKEETAENSVKPEQEMSSRRRKAKDSIEKFGKEGFSLADEISKLKGLLDCGVLTQEEFDEAKKKLIAKV